MQTQQIVLQTTKMVANISVNVGNEAISDDPNMSIENSRGIQSDNETKILAL